MRKIVEPIRNLDELESIKYAFKKYGENYYLIFIIGISTNLRISDILLLKKSHFIDKNDVLKLNIQIVEKKTNKNKVFCVTDNLRAALIDYFSYTNIHYDDFLFFNKKTGKPFSRQAVSKIFIRVRDELNLDYCFNTHSMRKTWGYFAYRRGYPLAMIMSALNHRSLEQTLKYIGITQDEINEMYHELNL